MTTKPIGHPIAHLDAARVKRRAILHRAKALKWLNRLDDNTLAALNLNRQHLARARKLLG